MLYTHLPKEMEAAMIENDPSDAEKASLLSEIHPVNFGGYNFLRTRS